MDVLLAQPRGFCAGVVRAITIVERALEIHGAPVYVYHEIVHNAHVVERLTGLGAIFVSDVAAIPRGAHTVFSAHGVSNRVAAEAAARCLKVVDATCPLVAKVHLRAQRYSRLGYVIVIVGHPGHEEVEGTMGSVDGPVHLVSSCEDVELLPIPLAARVAYVTQTTLSLDDTREIIDALRARYAALEGPDLDDICYATQNRQAAVRTMAPQIDLMLVVGSRNSSNSNRLREVAIQSGVRAHLIHSADELDEAWLHGVACVGITAGASTPEALVNGVRERLMRIGAVSVREMSGEREAVTFRLPASLIAAA